VTKYLAGMKEVGRVAEFFADLDGDEKPFMAELAKKRSWIQLDVYASGSDY